MIFLLKVLFKSFQNRVFFRFWRRDPVLDLQLFAQSCVKMVLCKASVLKVLLGVCKGFCVQFFLWFLCVKFTLCKKSAVCKRLGKCGVR